MTTTTTTTTSTHAIDTLLMPPTLTSYSAVSDEVCERRRKKKRRRAKVPAEKGVIVWDGDPSIVPPVAYIVQEVYEDPGDVRREQSTSLYLKSLEPTPRHVWRLTTQVTNFDETLRMIYRERRPMLEAQGVWPQTVAMVKQAVLHRLLSNMHLTVTAFWTKRMELGDEACPVTELEAADWLRSSIADGTSADAGAARHTD
jgi:hypothetical protein